MPSLVILSGILSEFCRRSFADDNWSCWICLENSAHIRRHFCVLERSSFKLSSSDVAELDVVRSTKDWSFPSMVSSRASRSLVAVVIRSL